MGQVTLVLGHTTIEYAYSGEEMPLSKGDIISCWDDLGQNAKYYEVVSIVHEALSGTEDDAYHYKHNRTSVYVEESDA